MTQTNPFNIQSSDAQSLLQTPHSRHLWYRYLRLLLVATAIVVCLFAIRSAATFGLSRLLATYSLSARNLSAAKKAVELAPKDTEAHFANAVVLGMSDKPEQSVTELEQAVALRPATTRFGSSSVSCVIKWATQLRPWRPSMKL